MTASAIYEGTVLHERFQPREHAFEFRIAQLYLDLDELPGLLDSSRLLSTGWLAPLRFCESDYLPDRNGTLKDAALDIVQEATGSRPSGAVRLLTHVRTFGYVFNPVSFYYCFDADDALAAVVAEITNTPWKQRHCYVTPVDPKVRGAGARAEFEKAFHVSPFMGMDYRYRWAFTEPGTNLVVHMENVKGGARAFRALQKVERRPFNERSLGRVLWRYPIMTLRIVAAIHWQAFRLWRKNIPFHSHPDKVAAKVEASGRPR